MVLQMRRLSRFALVPILLAFAAPAMAATYRLDVVRAVSSVTYTEIADVTDDPGSYSPYVGGLVSYSGPNESLTFSGDELASPDQSGSFEFTADFSDGLVAFYFPHPGAAFDKSSCTGFFERFCNYFPTSGSLNIYAEGYLFGDIKWHSPSGPSGGLYSEISDFYAGEQWHLTQIGGRTYVHRGIEEWSFSLVSSTLTDISPQLVQNPLPAPALMLLPALAGLRMLARRRRG